MGGKDNRMNSQIHKTRKGKEINSNVKLVKTQSAVKSIMQMNGEEKGGGGGGKQKNLLNLPNIQKSNRDYT